MGLSKLLLRTRGIHVLFVSLALIAVNIIVNLFLDTGQRDIFNAYFGLLIPVAVFLCFAVVGIVAIKQNHAFSRTIIIMGITMLFWVIGDAIYLFLLHSEVDPFQSAGDIFYIAATLLLVVSVLTFQGSLPPTRRRNMIYLEISILFLTATIIFITLIMLPGDPNLDFDRFTLIMIFIYPVLDAIALWVIVIVFFAFTVNTSRKMSGAILVGTLFLLISDTFYLINNLYSEVIGEYLVDIGYYLFYTFFLIAGLIAFKERKIRRLPVRDKKAETFRQGNWIVFIPGVFLITVIGLLLFFVFSQTLVFFHGIVILIGLIIILFIIHQYFVITDNIKLTNEMRQINALLESRVEQRTADLSKANAELEEEMKEREKAENHLALINEELLQVNREKDKLFSILAHDLRSPLGSIMKLSELLVENSQDFDEDEMLEVAGTLNKSASQTFQLLNDLLAWSAVQMGRGERKREHFRVGEVISDTIQLFASDAESKHIRLLVESDPEFSVFADKFAIQTVIRNLLSNAVKFTPNAGFVSLKAELDGDFVKISVTDNGIGIPEEKQKKLFRIDAVSSSPGTEGEKGTGFGLLLCKDLVERNGGEIGLISEKGKGSTFYFTLPVKKSDDVQMVKPDAKPYATIEYMCDHSKKLAFTTLKGKFTPITLRSELSQLWTGKAYIPEYSVLIDVRTASFDVDIKELPDVLKIFNEMPGNQTNKKFALLTSTPQQVAFATMFGQNVRNRYHANVEVFSTYDAAMNWLEVK
jgi:signal transduction histidine kinase